MSFTGNNPRFKWLNLEPQSADPTSPNEGDLFRSNGTPRDEGLWVYEGGAWVQVSTGATLSVLTDLTLTPQSSDPATPAEGMIFRADGTSRAEGLWEYQNGDWVQITGLRYQEFQLQSKFNVRAASTANVLLASAVENGDSFGGVTLATSDIILLKNQTTPTENGVYVVAASGAPSRHVNYDTFSELNDAVIYVEEGTNARQVYYQTAVLTSLSDAQTWDTTPAAKSFVVPEGVYEVDTLGAGGGAGGAGGGGRNTYSSGGGGAGGGGGGGGHCQEIKVNVTPGETLTIELGKGGLGGSGGTSGSNNAGAGSAGATTYLKRGSTVIAQWLGGAGGGRGGGGGSTLTNSATGAAGSSTAYASGGSAGTPGSYSAGGGGGAGGIAGISSGGDGGTSTVAGTAGSLSGGGGGGGAQVTVAGANGGAGGLSEYYFTASSGGASPGDAGGGGGGGAAIGAGGDGGEGGSSITVAGHGQLGGGAGGGGGSDNTPTNGMNGGAGGDGYLKISWS